MHTEKEDIILKLLSTMVAASENRTKVADKALCIGFVAFLITQLIWASVIVIINMFA